MCFLIMVGFIQKVDVQQEPYIMYLARFCSEIGSSTKIIECVELD